MAPPSNAAAKDRNPAQQSIERAETKKKNLTALAPLEDPYQ